MGPFAPAKKVAKSPSGVKFDPRFKMIGDEQSQNRTRESSLKENQDSSTGSKKEVSRNSLMKNGFNWAQCDYVEISDEEVDN